jgi:hypothetical protein
MAKTGSTRGVKRGRAGKRQQRANPLMVGRSAVRATRGSKVARDGAHNSPFALGLALMATSVRLAGVCLAHPLALVACRSPLDLYRTQASAGVQILRAYEPLLSAAADLARAEPEGRSRSREGMTAARLPRYR